MYVFNLILFWQEKGLSPSAQILKKLNLTKKRKENFNFENIYDIFFVN
jgi:hypothetical protein